MSSHDAAVDSILEHWTRASEDHVTMGKAWYRESRRFAHILARRHGVTVRTAAGVIAALSPRNTWAENKRGADVVLAASAAGLELPAVGLKRNAERAWRIAGGERPLDVLGGPKTRAFYRNITGDQHAVTVDTWAARAAGHADSISPKQYAAIAAAYVAAAAMVNVPPAVLQAAVWIAIRGRSD